MTPRVTVLMSVYNGAAYVRQAIESVLDQTLSDFELVIIDDASTDDTLACVRSYPDARIRLICHERNLGQARSLNTGLAIARGRYVARLDQDDVCLPDRLQDQVAVLESRPDLAAVGTWQRWVDPAGRPLRIETGVVALSDGNFGAFLGVLLTQATPIGHSTAMFRREVLSGVGGYDDTFAPCEDYELWCRLAQRRCRVGVVRRPLVVVRIHPGRQSIAKHAVQRAQAHRAHAGLVLALDEGHRAGDLGALLRMEEDFWSGTSGRDVSRVLQDLVAFLARVRERFGLSRQEAGHLSRRVYWWLGRGALLASLQRQGKSLPVYVCVVRRCPGLLLRAPALLAYPGCALMSRLFVPPVRRGVTRVVEWLRWPRVAVRLLIDGLRAPILTIQGRFGLGLKARGSPGPPFMRAGAGRLKAEVASGLRPSPGTHRRWVGEGSAGGRQADGPPPASSQADSGWVQSCR